MAAIEWFKVKLTLGQLEKLSSPSGQRRTSKLLDAMFFSLLGQADW
jgi:hypothetical protein